VRPTVDGGRSRRRFSWWVEPGGSPHKGPTRRSKERSRKPRAMTAGLSIVGVSMKSRPTGGRATPRQAAAQLAGHTTGSWANSFAGTSHALRGVPPESPAGRFGTNPPPGGPPTDTAGRDGLAGRMQSASPHGRRHVVVPTKTLSRAPPRSNDHGPDSLPRGAYCARARIR